MTIFERLSIKHCESLLTYALLSLSVLIMFCGLAAAQSNIRENTRKLMAEISADSMSDDVRRLKELLPDCEQVIANLENAGSPKEVAETYRDCGIINKRLKNTDEAVKLLTQAAELAKLSGNARTERAALVWLGDTYEQLYRIADAIRSYERAVAIANELKSKQLIANDLAKLAAVYWAAGESEKAIDHLLQAIPINGELKDSDSAIDNLYNLGWILRESGRLEDSLKAFKTGVVGAKHTFNRKMTVSYLREIGTSQAQLGNYSDAMLAYEEGIFSLGVNPDPATKAVILSEISDVHKLQGNYRTALEVSGEAIELAEKSANKSAQTVANLSKGKTYLAIGDSRSALPYYVLAHVFSARTGDARILIDSFLVVANFHLSTGDPMKAEEMCRELVETITSAENLRPLDAAAFRNVAAIYERLGKPELQLQYLNRALASAQQRFDKAGEFQIRLDIAYALFPTDKKQGAIEHLEKALELAKGNGIAGQKARAYQSLGAAFTTNPETYAKARAALAEALFIDSSSGNTSGEAETLSLLMRLEESAGNLRLSIFYGKAYAARIQELRASTRGLDVETQKSLVVKSQSEYRYLVHSLAYADRLEEAIQMMNILKDQQFFDGADPLRRKWRVPSTSRETRLLAQYDRVSKANAEAAKGRLGVAPPGGFTTKENPKNRPTTDFPAFNTFLRSLETEFAASPDESDAKPKIFEVDETRATLGKVSKEVGHEVVAVYNLVGINTFRIMIITSAGIESVSHAVKGDELNVKAKQFWGLLQTESYDPTRLGKELHDIVFKPVEEKLPKNTQTILWSVDGNLRYIPMSALFDGKQYLVERYNNVNFTRANFDAMARPVSTGWTATGLGTSKAHTVTLLGASISFAALPGVTQEINDLFMSTNESKILEGQIILDEKFTRASIAKRERSTAVLHIASHFSFRPGDDARSFLLLGDGTAFTLADMKKEKDMFAGVELLTLSACNTAAQQADANGREVDAFFELAQRLGAQSVMATLWPVADNSTPWLMREFYELKVNKKQNKAEALRNAQLALLRGSAKATRSTVRNDASRVNIIVAGDGTKVAETRADHFIIEKKDAKPYVADPARPFAHPFYWSPFVLIGNWR